MCRRELCNAKSIWSCTRFLPVKAVSPATVAYLGVRLWVSVKPLETIVITTDAMRIKLKGVEAPLNPRP